MAVSWRFQNREPAWKLVSDMPSKVRLPFCRVMLLFGIVSSASEVLNKQELNCVNLSPYVIKLWCDSMPGQLLSPRCVNRSCSWGVNALPSYWRIAWWWPIDVPRYDIAASYSTVEDSDTTQSSSVWQGSNDCVEWKVDITVHCSTLNAKCIISQATPFAECGLEDY